MSYHFIHSRKINMGFGIGYFNRIIDDLIDSDLVSYCPKPKYDSGDYCYYIKLKQVRQYENIAKSICYKLECGLSIGSIEVMFLRCWDVISADATAYICDMADEADKLNLEGIKRKRFLQRGSSKYRAIWG